MSDEELMMYHSVHPRARPGVCIGELKKHVELMCLRLEKGESVFVRVVTPHVQNVLNAHEAMIRIRCVRLLVGCICSDRPVYLRQFYKVIGTRPCPSPCCTCCTFPHSSLCIGAFVFALDGSNIQHLTPQIPSNHNSTPFLYQTDPVGTFLCVQFLVIVYYGLLAISNLIEK
jgi:hypothetical protein